MTREQKWAFGVLLALSVVLNVAFGAEHIAIVYDATVHSPQTLDPNPPCHLVRP